MEIKIYQSNRNQSQSAFYGNKFINQTTVKQRKIINQIGNNQRASYRITNLSIKLHSIRERVIG